jgi:hypothetical protein
MNFLRFKATGQEGFFDISELRQLKAIHKVASMQSRPNLWLWWIDSLTSNVGYRSTSTLENYWDQGRSVPARLFRKDRCLV